MCQNAVLDCRYHCYHLQLNDVYISLDCPFCCRFILSAYSTFQTSKQQQRFCKRPPYPICFTYFGVILWGQMLGFIFQHHGSQMGMEMYGDIIGTIWYMKSLRTGKAPSSLGKSWYINYKCAISNVIKHFFPRPQAVLKKKSLTRFISSSSWRRLRLRILSSTDSQLGRDLGPGVSRIAMYLYTMAIGIPLYGNNI